MNGPALNIKDSDAHRLAKELATRRGVSLTRAVKDALAEALAATPVNKTAKFDRLLEISKRFDELPVYDDRTVDEILGYDDDGLPS